MNGYGTATSNAAILNILLTPAFSMQPANDTLCLGSVSTFIIAPLGASPFSYQWIKNGNDTIYSANDSILSINSVELSDTGYYKCFVSNSYGNVSSNNAYLYVSSSKPNIIQQSTDSTECSGTNFILNISATNMGNSPLLYYWYKNNQLLTANSEQDSIKNISVNDAGNYNCVVTNACGSVTSVDATLSVNSPSTVIQQPQSAVRCINTSYSFSLLVSGTAPFSYQWYKLEEGNWHMEDGATDSILTLNSITLADTGKYICVIENVCGSITSKIATLYTESNIPTLTQQPLGGSRCAGTNIEFDISGNNSQLLTYQWYKDDTLTILYAIDSVFILNHVSQNDAGNYKCVVTNSCGSVTSNEASLIVNQIPYISQQPEWSRQCSGTPFLFNISTTNSRLLTYQWYFNDTTLIPGAIDSVYTINSVSSANSGFYSCVVSNSYCNNTSMHGGLIVSDNLPVINQQPIGSSQCINNNFTFSIFASSEGDPYLTYQWYENDTILIPSGISNSYSIIELSQENKGNYRCAVTNSCGSVTSDEATLSINNGTHNLYTETACNSYWWNGITYTTSGIYTYSYTNASGCASTDTLHLTINNSTHNAYTETSCNSYVWRIENGELRMEKDTTFYNSGIYLFNYTDSLGCASADTLHLTINNSSTSSLTESACNSYILNGQSYTTSGVYTQNLTNKAGCDSTLTLNLTINTSPSVSLQTNGTDNSVTFEAVASGTSPLSYQWYKIVNSEQLIVNNANESTFTFNSINLSDTGRYMCVVNNICGIATSNALTLDVYMLPVITQQPQSVSSDQGSDVSFNITAIGSAPLSYQWQKLEAGNWTLEAGQTTNNYQLISITKADTGSYSCVVTNECGSVTSSEATLTVNSPPPKLLKKTSEVSKTSEVNIYPNPNDGSFTLEVQLPDDENVEIEAYDVVGQLVLTEIHGMSKGDNKVNMKINNGCCGLYMITMKTAKQTFYNKIIIE